MTLDEMNACAKLWEKASEAWRMIKGWEGFYEASSHGQIRSLTRMVHVDRSTSRSYDYEHQGMVLNKSHHNRPGSFCSTIALTNAPDDRIVTVIVSRVVWEAFIGPVPDGHMIYHKKGLMHDELWNLKIITYKENGDLHKSNLLWRSKGKSV